MRHHGTEVDTQGDAFFFVFGSADDALAAAGEGCELLESGSVHVRIGVHTGTPQLTSEGYVGADVHLAARIGAVGHGGQVVLSSATQRELGVGHDLRDLGEHRLKDFDDPVPLYQLGTRRFPPLRTIANTNLPRPASSFVGRADDAANVVARIRGGARLLTLTGPGGSGRRASPSRQRPSSCRTSKQASSGSRWRRSTTRSSCWKRSPDARCPRRTSPRHRRARAAAGHRQLRAGRRRRHCGRRARLEVSQTPRPRHQPRAAPARGEFEYPVEPLPSDDAGASLAERRAPGGRDRDRAVRGT